MKKLLFSLLLLFSSIGVFAQHRSEQQAMQIAQEFFNPRPAAHASRLAAVPQAQVQASVSRNMARANQPSAQNSACYIINDEANNRFVIVSADERLHDILGYSDNGIFNTERMPAALYDLIYQFGRQCSQICKQPFTIQDEMRKTDVQKVSEIEPMITSQWSQLEPFNADCPLDKTYSKDTLSATGCIATAMAQLLYYWKYPNQCSGTYTYLNPYYSGLQLIHFNYDNYEINWDNLVDNYNNATEEQKAEVAKLMFACGVSVAMGYSADGSGSMDYNIPYALKHYFGYNPNIVYRNRDHYANDEWNTMIINELRNGRPVLYSGYNERHRGGHEFIIDGCNADGLYHFNFGQAFLISNYLWSGIGDGYYLIDAVKPTFLGEEIGDWSYFQSMVIGITPETTGEHEDTFYASYYNLNSFGTTCYFQLNAQCYSSDAIDYFATNERFNGMVGIGLFDKDLNYLKSLYSEPVSMKSDSSYTKLLEKIEIDANSMSPEEDYYIAPYALADGFNKPTRIRAFPPKRSENHPDVVDFYYKANLNNGIIELTEIYVRNSPVPNPIIGDSNGDGNVDISDITTDVDYIMGNSPSKFVFENADVDKDSEIDIADITLTVNIILEPNAAMNFANLPVYRELALDNNGKGEHSIKLNSTSLYVASQFDIVTASNSSIQNIYLNNDDSHILSYDRIGDNRYRVVVYSFNNKPYSSNNESLFTIITSNNEPIEIENAIFVTKDSDKRWMECSSNDISNIYSVKAENSFTIYSVNGQIVREGAKSTENLPKGVYIINSVKYVVK